jgi:hypothetical protein
VGEETPSSCDVGGGDKSCDEGKRNPVSKVWGKVSKHHPPPGARTWLGKKAYNVWILPAVLFHLDTVYSYETVLHLGR